MIITEHFLIEDLDFVRTWSDANRYVVRDGISYEEACDPASFGRTYTEGDTIPAADEDYAAAGRILMGVES